MRVVADGTPLMVIVKLKVPHAVPRTGGKIIDLLPAGAFGLWLEPDSLELVEMPQSARDTLLKQIYDGIPYCEYFFSVHGRIVRSNFEDVKIVRTIPEAQTLQEVAAICGTTESAIHEQY